MSRDNSCWRDLIASEAKCHNDDISRLIVYPETVSWPQDRWSDVPLEDATDQPTLDVQFGTSYGTAEGPSFTAWTADRVYFPVVYDGAEWCGSAPRNPCDIATAHVGGQ